jgi:hypothetical protein
MRVNEEKKTKEKGGEGRRNTKEKALSSFTSTDISQIPELR